MLANSSKPKMRSWLMHLQSKLPEPGNVQPIIVLRELNKRFCYAKTDA